MMGRPVCVLPASESAGFCSAAVAETLSTISASVVGGNACRVPVNGRRLDAAEIAADPQRAIALCHAVDLVAAAVATKQT